MLENSVYSVITPEGCAAILWKDAGRSNEAAECLRLTADDLQNFGLIDEIIPEKNIWKFPSEEDSTLNDSFTENAQNMKKILQRHLQELNNLEADKRIEIRFQKFRKMGNWIA
jgi:acetyl-CoA carboxylase carboxyl transferase subunit alpha